MQIRFITFACAAQLWLVAAVPAVLQYRYTLHERREWDPHGWVKRVDAPLPRDAILPMRIGMTQRNVEQAEGLLMAISDPESPSYGQHYTESEVHALFEPAVETVRTVKGWLESAGINGVTLSYNRQWLQFDTRLAYAEKLFQTQYHTYEHVETGEISIACDEYHLPEHVTRHVDYIMPGLRLIGGNTHRLRKRGIDPHTYSPSPIVSQDGSPGLLNLTVEQQLTMCDQYIFPPCIAGKLPCIGIAVDDSEVKNLTILALYNITKRSHPYTAVGNQLGIFESGSYLNSTDLKTFLSQVAKNVPPNTMPVQYNIDGPGYNGHLPQEANLDYQLAYPIVWPQNIGNYQTDPINFWSKFLVHGGLFNTFLDGIDGSYCNFTAYGETGNSKIDPQFPDGNPPDGYNGTLQCGQFPRPNVISLSYGKAEVSLPSSYQRRQCLEYLKFGMQGTSVVFCTQDAGVEARYFVSKNSFCLNPNGKVFAPDFPANCPWVLTVGSTYLPPGANVYKDEEVATTSFPSGGGFSNIYTRPTYQNAKVESYLQNYDPPYQFYSLTDHNNHPSVNQSNGGVYNRVGRAYPDVSAVGDNIVTITYGNVSISSGTSASTPVWAAILARINEERLVANKSTIGFVNPVLYKNPGVMHDITTGNNPGCGTEGFSAAPGWDPVTGLGTPSYPKLLKLFMSLP